MRGPGRRHSLSRAQLPGDSLSPLPPQRQFCGAFGATRERGPALPERGYLQRILDMAEVQNIGFSHFVSIGSMADLDFAEMIDYLGNDDQVRSILIYMESLVHHRQFMSAARSVSRVKPIIVVKSGRSEAAARAATSHTGALAGKDEAYNAAFRRAGIIRVDTIAQLFNCAEALGKMSRPWGGTWPSSPMPEDQG